ncbi:hypothetical protein [Planococcus shixiaomingii]|uniref:hypothetical protein n=1 Tax=Planococcus shixiaomingii TaxID=3058393 RepID=UPI00260941D3|nr:hypothetical protein [Planococcus sp. N022]WKA53071.1 hypothetical protein QWY21_10380 [Planococcus sp. N022]
MFYEKTDSSNNKIPDNKDSFPSVEKMDNYLKTLARDIESTVVCDSVKRVFGIDIDLAPLLHSDYVHLEYPRAAIDSYLQQHGIKEGHEIRSMIKQLFGINLTGIAELHQDRISLYSKDQWIVKNNKSLIHVHTGKNDVDVKILPTAYFTEHTGLVELPQTMQDALAPLGYSYHRKEQAYYYSELDGLPVSGEFKVQTMKTIAKIIKQHYAHL